VFLADLAKQRRSRTAAIHARRFAFGAELYEGREVPSYLVKLMNDKVWCDQAGDYILMDDPAQLILRAQARTWQAPASMV
jgi:hypothetical protein